MSEQKVASEKTQPLVTVVIPSFNHAQYIDQAIESVFAQTYPNVELIVIDDGSTDATRDVLRKYESREGIQVVLNPVNKGQSAVMNQAVRMSRGEFICLLPSDDWFLPEKLALQVAKFQQSGPDVGVVYANGSRYFQDTGETKLAKLPVFTGRVAEKFITWGIFIYPVTPMFRRECLVEIPMDESYRAEGEAYYIRVALRYAFEHVDAVVAVMRDHTYNVGKDVRLMYEEVFRYWTRLFAREDIPADFKKLRSSTMSRFHRTKAFQFIGELGDLRMGRICLQRAIAAEPLQALNPRTIGALAICWLPKTLAEGVMKRFRRRKHRFYESGP